MKPRYAIGGLLAAALASGALGAWWFTRAEPLAVQGSPETAAAVREYLQGPEPPVPAPKQGRTYEELKSIMDYEDALKKAGMKPDPRN